MDPERRRLIRTCEKRCVPLDALADAVKQSGYGLLVKIAMVNVVSRVLSDEFEVEAFQARCEL
jgi:hypothetical protein